MKFRKWKPLLSVLGTLAMVACTKNVTNNVPGTNTLTPVYSQAGQHSPSDPGTGTINGGGGRGVLCEKNGRKSVQVLDLYEGKSVYDLTPIQLDNDQNKALDQLSMMLGKHFWNPYSVPLKDFAAALRKSYIQPMVDSIHFLDAGKTLELSTDAYAPTLEAGCQPVQIAYYYDESVLLVDRALWDQLDMTNKMALIAHEAMYFLARQSGTTNSMSTRKLVGMMFSTKSVTPVFDGLPGDVDGFLNCDLELPNGFNRGQVYIYNGVDPHQDYEGPPDRGMELVFNFNGIGDGQFRNSAFLSGVLIQSLQLPSFHASADSQLDVDTYQSKGQVHVEFLGVADNLIKAQMNLQLGPNEAAIDLNMTCELPRDFSKLAGAVTAPGHFVNKQGDDLTIGADGAITYISTGQEAASAGRGGAVPYPTVCRTIEHGFMLNRTSNSLTYKTSSVELGDLTGLTDTAHCPDYVAYQNRIASTGQLQLTIDLNEFK